MTLLVSLAAFLLAALAYTCLMLVVPRLVDAAVDDGLRQRAGDLQADIAAGDTVVDPLAQVLGPDGTVVGGPVEQPLLEAGEAASVPPEGLVAEVDVAALGGQLRLLAVPVGEVPGPEGPLEGGVVVVAARLATLEGLTVRVADVLAAASGVLVVLTSVGAWFLVGAVLRPVSAMTTAAARIGARPGSGRLPRPGTGDEVDRLAQTFNDLLERVEAGARRERAFVDDASHELRTPLTVLRGELELAADEPDPAVVRVGVLGALGAVERLSRMSEDLLVLARLDDGSSHRPGPVDLVDLARHVRDAAARVPALTVEVVVQAPDEGRPASGPRRVETSLDTPAFSRAVDNLLRNAAAAGARHVQVGIAVDGRGRRGAVERPSTDAAGSPHVRITVQDDGPGFPPAFLPVAFERFTQPEHSRAGRGTGLGLALVRAFADSHHGTAQADNRSVLGGARVLVRLPSRQPSSP